MANQIVISRIQNRRGIRENLPQPLLPGELALTVDTGELWIGTDPNQPPWGVRTYGSGAGDRSSAESIVDLQIVSAQFTADLQQSDFDALVLFFKNSSVVVFSPSYADANILWDGGSYIFISADTGVDPANTITAVVSEVVASGVGTPVAQAFDALGAINDPSVDPSGPPNSFDSDGQFLFGSGNAAQGANAARLINQIHGAQLVTTLSNLQVTTSGIGVGSSTFRDMTVIDDALPGVVWAQTGTLSADSVTDELTWVSGDGINIELDTTLDAIRITNTIDSDTPNTTFTLAGSTASMTNVTGLTFNLETSDISDVIFLSYSANIGGSTPGINNYTIAGTMQIVGNILVGTGTATLADNQVEVRDAGLAGAVNFQALYVAGSPDVIQIQFTNTFVDAVSLKVLRKRWSSF